MYKIYGLTDVGKVREMNEDGFVLNDVLINDGDYYDVVETNFIAAICDGMGGEKSGELASFLALEAFVTFWSEGMLSTTRRSRPCSSSMWQR